ncbi:hypothetical protein L7F22_043728 [Adiantum nelumboides]|nr:hypothetical protein [Adiantum nelumboides]
MERVESKQLQTLDIIPTNQQRSLSGSHGSQNWKKGLETPPVLSRAMKEPPREQKESSTGQLINIRQVLSRPSAKKEEEKTSTENENNGIFSWSDEQLAERYNFIKEVGFGNWGSCWRVTAKQDAVNLVIDKEYAIKLVHRHGTPPSNARVKALWNEYKVLRSCGKPGHPNLVHFKEFIITPSYALVAMDYYRQAMNVALPVSLYAGPNGYFKQLLSSINWLHERKVTHCDIKVANLLVDLTDDTVRGRPILVDFGFATLHDAKTNFQSTQTWGTPEYLSPERSRGDRHDERLSDIWALGVTFFEIATGRTPFEQDDEQFLTKEQLDEYYRRTINPEWVGTWSIPKSLEKLCKRMLTPEPAKRIFTGDALQHSFFREDFSDDLGDIDASLREELRKECRDSNMTESLVLDPANEDSMLESDFNLRTPRKDHSGQALSSCSTKFDHSNTSIMLTPDRARDTGSTHSPDVSSNSIGLTNLSPQECTPPCVPKKDNRREQVRIILDESDSEDIRNRSGLADLTASSFGEDLASDDDVIDANLILQQQQQQGPSSSGSIFRELIWTTPPPKAGNRTRSASDGNKSPPSKVTSPAMKKSPYPPSSSKKAAVNKGTSSSERRHSQQDSPKIGDSSIIIHGTSFEMATPTHTSYAKSYTKLEFDQAVKKLNESVLSMEKSKANEAHSPISSTEKKVYSNGEVSPFSPPVPLPQSALFANIDSQAMVSDRASLQTRMSDLSKMEQQIQEFRQSTLLQQDNAVTANNLRELNSEQIFARLAEMDELARTLAMMVRETRAALQHYCDQDVISNTSQGYMSPQHHQMQNRMSKTIISVENPNQKKHKRQLSLSKLNLFSSRRKQSVASNTQLAMTVKQDQILSPANANRYANNMAAPRQSSGVLSIMSQRQAGLPENQMFVESPNEVAQKSSEILMRDQNDPLNMVISGVPSASQALWWQQTANQAQMQGVSGSDLAHSPVNQIRRAEEQKSKANYPPSSSTSARKLGNVGRPSTASGALPSFGQSGAGVRRTSEPEAGMGALAVSMSNDKDRPRGTTLKHKMSKVKTFTLSRANSVTSNQGNRSSIVISPRHFDHHPDNMVVPDSGSAHSSQTQERMLDLQTMAMHGGMSVSPLVQGEAQSTNNSLNSMPKYVLDGRASPTIIHPSPSHLNRERSTSVSQNAQSPNHSGGVLWRLLTNRVQNQGRNAA